MPSAISNVQRPINRLTTQSCVLHQLLPFVKTSAGKRFLTIYTQLTKYERIPLGARCKVYLIIMGLWDSLIVLFGILWFLFNVFATVRIWRKRLDRRFKEDPLSTKGNIMPYASIASIGIGFLFVLIVKFMEGKPEKIAPMINNYDPMIE